MAAKKTAPKPYTSIKAVLTAQTNGTLPRGFKLNFGSAAGVAVVATAQGVDGNALGFISTRVDWATALAKSRGFKVVE